MTKTSNKHNKKEEPHENQQNKKEEKEEKEEEEVNNNNPRHQFEFKVFKDDVVIILPKKFQNSKEKPPLAITQKAHRGVVQRVGGSTNEDDSSEEDEQNSEESEEEENRIPKIGEARVLWLDKDEENVEKIPNLYVVDRSFLHGDIVALRNDPFGQSGTVVNAELSVDLIVANMKDLMERDKMQKKKNKKLPQIERRRINGMNSAFLRRLHRFKLGNYCILEKDVVCQMDDVFFDIMIRFPNDAQCILKNPDPDVLFNDDDVSNNELDALIEEELEVFGVNADSIANGEGPFLGQRIIFDTKEKKKLLKSGEWVNGSYSDKLKIGRIAAMAPSAVSLQLHVSRKADIDSYMANSSLFPHEVPEVQTDETLKQESGAQEANEKPITAPKSNQNKKAGEEDDDYEDADEGSGNEGSEELEEDGEYGTTSEKEEEEDEEEDEDEPEPYNARIESTTQIETFSFYSPYDWEVGDKGILNMAAIETLANILHDSSLSFLTKKPEEVMLAFESNLAQNIAQNKSAFPNFDEEKIQEAKVWLKSTIDHFHDCPVLKKANSLKEKSLFFTKPGLIDIDSAETSICSVSSTSTIIDVLWQDGTLSRGIPATDLVPVNHVGESDFFPRDFVVEKKEEKEEEDSEKSSETKENGKNAAKAHEESKNERHEENDSDDEEKIGNSKSSSSNNQEVGIIKSVNSKEKICTVIWNSNPPREDKRSIYELISHEDYTFRLGDLVMLLPSDDEENTETQEKTDDTPSKNVIARLGAQNIEELQKNNPNAWVGEIIDITENGLISVCWVDNSVTHGIHFSSLVECEQMFEDDEDSDEDDDENEEDEESEEDENEEDEERGERLVDVIDQLNDSIRRISNPNNTDQASQNNPNDEDYEDVDEDEDENDEKRHENREKEENHENDQNRPENEEDGDWITVAERRINENSPQLQRRLQQIQEGQQQLQQVSNNIANAALQQNSSSQQNQGSDASGDAIPVPTELISRIQDFVSPEDPEGNPKIFFKKQKSSRKYSSSSSSEDDDYIPDEKLESQHEKLQNDILLEEAKKNSEIIIVQDELFQENSIKNISQDIASSSSNNSNPTSPSESNNLNPNSSYLRAKVRSEIIQSMTYPDEDKFTVVSNIADHYFLTNQQSGFGNFMEDGNPNLQNQVFPPNFNKVVMKEWKILQNSLPDGIYVRACESRKDLLRAIIIGPPLTPYHDGIFVFDLFLPYNYPAVPPKVHFWSFGYKINPNLYPNGRVCLSLLGTWEGREDCEVWIPKESNILQLLVSFVGLILVTEPYFNEAGYEKQIGTQEGQHNSSNYNENTILLVIDHMSKTMKHCPQHVETIMRKHYCSRKDAILSRFSKYQVYMEKSPKKENGKQKQKSPENLDPELGEDNEPQHGEEMQFVPIPGENYDECGLFDLPSKGFLLYLKKKLPPLQKQLSGVKSP